MESSSNVTTPCSSDAAACNPAASVRIPDVDPDSYTDLNWPRYLVIKSLDNKSILKHNLFVIAKAIEGIAGKPKEVRSLRNAGLLLIEVDRKQYAINLLKTKHLHDIPVDITPHRSMNSSKGVFTCGDLSDMDDKEILKQLKESGQNIQDLYRIHSFKSGKKEPTDTFVVTYSTKVLPEKIYVGHYRVSVRVYIPNPRKCTLCQKFGHTKNFCKNELVCCKCGQSGHDEDNCISNEVYCVNCKGPHKASSKECELWKTEKAIVKYKFENDVSFPEARKKIEETTKNLQNNSKSYSSVVTGKVTTCEMGVQTELTWPSFLTSPVLSSECFKTVDQSTQSSSNEMETVSGNSKRTISNSSSNEDDMPTLFQHKRLDLNGLESIRSNLNFKYVSNSVNAENESRGANSLGGVTTNMSSGGAGGLPPKPPDCPPPPTSRSGSNDTSRSGVGRDRSPIKPP